MIRRQERFAEQSYDDDIVVVAVDVNTNDNNNYHHRSQRDFDNLHEDIPPYSSILSNPFVSEMNHTTFSSLAPVDLLEFLSFTNHPNATILANPNFFITKNISSTTTFIDPIPYGWRILWLIVSMSIFATGGIANILTAYVILYTSRTMRRASYVLIAGVAIADVWMCLLAHPSEVVASSCMFLWHIELPAWWCPVNETLLEIFSCTSILAQMWVAVNRGIAVFAPYFYRAHMRSVRVSAHLLIFGAIVPSVLFNGPGLFGLMFVHVRNINLGDCKHISPIAMIMQLHFGLFYAGPTAISIAIYLAIFMKIVITTSPRVRTCAASALKHCRSLLHTQRRASTKDASPVTKQLEGADVSTTPSNTSSKSGEEDTVVHVSGATRFSMQNPTSELAAAAQTAAPAPTKAVLTTTALRRHAQTATAMFVCVLLFAVAIVPPRILLVNDLYWRTPVLGIILKLALRTTFATNPIFYFCFNREFRAAYLRLFGIKTDLTHHHHHHHHRDHAQQNGGGNNNNNNNSGANNMQHDNYLGHQNARNNSHTGIIHLPVPHHHHAAEYHSDMNAANLDEQVGVMLPLLSQQTAAVSVPSTSTGSGSSLYSGKIYGMMEASLDRKK